MICGTCRHDNQLNAKFCSECGTPLARRCPACDTEQAPAARFCDECGTPLAATAPPTPASASSPSASRKRVTALFADLVGSTSFAERLDPEAVRASLTPYFALLQSTIDDHAGSVVKFLGDGMLALFGVPEVAEDDALRAVAAGVELQRRFRSFADEIRERLNVELGLRVGINTGELVIGADDADLVGDVLNTASRLEAACEPGRVLVGEDTWRLTRSNVTYEVLDEVRVKGKADAVATFQVVERDDPNGHGPSDDVTVFVGRSAELEVLGRVFHEAVAMSSARLATVIGAPGVGKTRLARELCAATAVRSFDVRLERRGSTTFTPIADLLRTAAGSGSLGDVERLLADHPERDRLVPVLASFLGHGEARTTEESFWAVRRLLELLAAEGPVIVVIDDIQWAEPLFWDLLDHLVEWTVAPVVLLALARPELRDLRPDLAQPGRRVTASIALEGLDPDTTLELAALLLGIDELPTDLADRLPESTEGNPLFVRELVQMLVDDGVLARDGDHWRLTIDADAIEVPPTILSLLASRVERLPDDERHVVELASVIGTEFDRGTLDALADTAVARGHGAAIERLRRKDLIEPSGQWSGDHPVYRFHHVLIRDAAYRRLLKARRAELHELVGRHVETSGVADDEADIIVAHHFEQVFRYRTELGALDAHTHTFATTAATRLRAAAELALEREDLSSAGNAAIRALELLAVDAGADRDELLLIGCEALLATGDATKASPLVDELHARSSDERLSAWADCFRAQMWSLTDAERLTEATEVTADAAGHLAAIGDESGVAKARLVRASCLARLGRVGDCEAELDLALGAARAAGDRRRTVAVLGAAPLAALWGPSPVARAGGRCLDVLRLLRITSASPTVEATSIRCQGMLEALRGRFDSARTKLETSRATARELGLRHGLFETELFAGMVELFAGDAAAAEPHLRAARDGLGRLGIGADAGQAAALLARSLLLQGRIAEADELAARALNTAGQNLQTAITAGAVLAEVRAAQGRHDDARRLVDQAISIASPTDVTLDHALTLLTAARVAAAANDRRGERRAIDSADVLLAAKGVTAPLDHRFTPATSASQAAEVATDRFTNAAWQTVRARLQASADGDTERVSEQILSVTGGGGGRFEAVAIRGDDLCLARVDVDADDIRSTRWLVAHVVDGSIGSLVWFDEDQLTNAFAELDRQYFESLGFAAGHWLVEAWPGVYSTGGDAVAPSLHPDVEYSEHRRFIQRTGGADDLLDSADANVAGRAIVPRVFRLTEQGTVFERVEVEAGAPGELRMILALAFADERIRRFDAFDPEDLDTALALFDRDGFDSTNSLLLAPASHDVPDRPFTNTAWEISLSADRAFALKDPTALLLHLSPDFVSVWYERLAGGRVEIERKAFVDVVLHVDGSARRIDRATELLAVRGDRLALTLNRTDHDGTVHVRYAVVESDDHQLIRYDWFDPDQLTEAVAELDRRWLADCGVPADAFVVSVWPRTSMWADDLTDIVHPDFEFTNHRSLRAGGDGGSFDELVRRGWVEADTWALVTDVHRFDESGCVYTRVERNGDDEICIVFVAEEADRALRRLDMFDPDQLDDALALFDGRAANARHRAAAGHDEPGRRFTNDAWELSLLVDAAFLRRDWDDLRARLAATFVAVWHERLAEGGSVEYTRTSFVETMSTVAAVDGLLDRTTELVAIRGDRLALVREAATYEAVLQVRYLVIECESDALIGIHWFDLDQLDDAIAELDRRWLAGCGVPPDAFVVEVWPRARTMDLDTLDDIVHPDFEFLSHGRLALEDHPSDFDGFVRRRMLTYEAGTSALIPVVHRFEESGTVYERVEVNDGFEISMVMVVEQADGALRRVDQFDQDDLEAALALFDERRYGSAPPDDRDHQRMSNRAFRIADEFGRAVIDGDRDLALSLLADDFEIDHRGYAGTALGLETRTQRAEIVDLMLTTATQEGAESLTRTLLASRGEDLYLAVSMLTTADGDELLNYALGEAGGSRLRRIAYYDESQLADAIDDLDRRYRLSCGIGDDHWVARCWGTLTSPDAEAYEAILAADYRTVEHRAVHLDVTDRDVFIAYLRATPASTSWSVPVIHRLSERGTVFEHLETWADGTGDTRMLSVVEFGDGVVLRIDAYEPGDLDAALARYDEIVGVSRRELTNGAWESVRRRQHAQGNLDHEGFASAFDDRFVAEFHDPLMRAIPEAAIFDKTGFLELILHQDMTHDGASSEMELIAIRDEDLCLYLVGMTNASGDLTQRLVVDAIRDGLCTRMDIFESDQLGDAIAELDRRYRLSCGIGDDHWIAENWSVLYATDFADLQQVLHPRFEYVERRRLGWPSGDADDWRQWLTPSTSAQETMIPAMYRLCEHGVVTQRSERFEAGELGVSESIVVNEAEDGRVRRVVSYEPDDLDRALADFDQFVAAAGQSRVLTNTAWELTQRAETTRRRGDRDGCASLLSDDIVVIAHDPIMAAIDGDRGAYDKEHYLDALFDAMVLGPANMTEQELVAARGDDRCLVRTTVTTAEGDLYERLNVVEVHDGLCVRIDVFPHDQLREAQITLDRRWLATLGFDDEEWIVRHWYLAYSMDFDDVGGALHEEFEFLDHRPLHFPSGDAGTLAETMGSIGHEVDVIIPQVHRISRSGAVIERIERAVGDMLGEEHQIIVTQIVGDAIRRTDLYTVDDLPAALARYEDGVSVPAQRLTNTAWELAQATLIAKAKDGDREHFESLLSDDFVATTHDPVMAQIDGGVFDKQRFMQVAFDPVLFRPTSTQEAALVAVRGDDRCLVRTTVTTAEGDLYERLNVVKVRDGLCARIDVFPHDQLREAQITLDHSWLTSLGFADDHPFFVLTELIYHSDPTVLLRAFSEDFRYVEHRRLSFPDGDRSQLLLNVNTQVGALEVVIPRYLRLTERLALCERIEQTVGGAAQRPGLYLTALGADGRIAYMEIFAVDDEDAAIACFDRLLADARTGETTTEQPIGTTSPANRASEIAGAFLAVFEHGNVSAIGHLFDPDGRVAYYIRLRTVETSTIQFLVDFVLDSRAEVSTARLDLETVAVRDEHLCLLDVDSWYDDDNLRMLAVIETDAERVVTMAWFDENQLVEAQLELDRRWLASTEQSGH